MNVFLKKKIRKSTIPNFSILIFLSSINKEKGVDNRVWENLRIPLIFWLHMNKLYKAT